VNTGNPGKKFQQGTGPVGVPVNGLPPTAKDTTMTLNLSALASGRVQFNVTKIVLVAKGQAVTDETVVLASYSDPIPIHSGELTTIVSDKAVAAGSYDRLVFTLTPSNPALFIDDNGQEERIAIAPHRLYTSTVPPADDSIRLVLTSPGETLAISSAMPASHEISSAVSAKIGAFSTSSEAVANYFAGMVQSDFKYTLEPLADMSVATSVTDDDGYLTVQTATSTIGAKQYPICVLPTSQKSLFENAHCPIGSYVSYYDKLLNSDSFRFKLPAGSYFVAVPGLSLQIHQIEVAPQKETIFALP
jgi:hypothetical protein